jgi:hypothetical protein
MSILIVLAIILFLAVWLVTMIYVLKRQVSIAKLIYSKVGGWFDRKRKTPASTFQKVALTIGVILAGFCCFAMLLLAVLLPTIRNSDAAKLAVATAASDPRAIMALGSPMKEGWFLSGNIATSGTSGTANLEIPVHGPNGSGKLFADEERKDGQWQIQTLILEVKISGERITLVPAVSAP